jgi:hypothetical protein
MTNQHGRAYEHTLANGLTDVCPDEVWSTTAGYSGNSASDHCDIVVALDPKLAVRGDTMLHLIEAKKRNVDSGKRCSNVFAGGKTYETGLEELQRFVDNTPSWASSIVALKFDRRKVIVLDALWLLSALGESKRPIPNDIREGVMDILDPRLTQSDNISMVKPSSDHNWPSSRQSEDDAVVLCESLGLPYEVSD